MAGNDLNENINDTSGVANLLAHWNKTKVEVWEFLALKLMGRGYKDKSYLQEMQGESELCNIHHKYEEPYINRFHNEEKHGKSIRTNQSGPGAHLTIFDAMTRTSFSLTSSHGKDIYRSIGNLKCNLKV